jgi:hypothetical protein
MSDQELRELAKLLKKCTPDELIKIFKQIKFNQ